MSPPKFTWPTRPCPRCGAVVPVHRYEASTMQMLGWRAFTAVRWVNWCGHSVEVVLLPDTDGWCREIRVLGEVA